MTEAEVRVKCLELAQQAIQGACPALPLSNAGLKSVADLAQKYFDYIWNNIKLC